MALRSFAGALKPAEPGDNAFCALLDSDLQAWLDGAWKALEEVRTSPPPSTPADSFAANGLTLMRLLAGQQPQRVPSA